MNMKTHSLKSLRSLLCLSLAPLWLVGCASGPDIKRVDATSQRGVETEGITIKDFQEAAEEMVKSLTDSVINTGQLQAPAGKKAMLEVSRIANNSPAHFDPDLLTFPIVTALNKTGKIVAKSTDQIAQGTAAAKDFERDDVKKIRGLADYTLSGKIIGKQDLSGNTRQSSFVFQLILNSTDADAVAVWQEQKIITKQRTRRKVGL